MTTAIIDERVALGAARLVIPSRNDDPVEVARLRADILSDLPRIDEAARRWTRLGADLPPTDAAVVGRLGWVRANLSALRGAFDPIAEKLTTRRAVASRVLGAQIGALLGLLSTKVLGQFVLPLGGPGGGQLLIVGPNLLDLADEFGPQAADIRRTVVLHEVTHRLQFDGVDWLGGHLRGLLRTYLENARVDAGALLEAAGRLPEAIQKVRDGEGFTPILHAVLTPDQLAVVDEAQGLMTLIEGHGNACMYRGAEGVVDDPEAVRASLGGRTPDLVAKVLTQVAGLEMKKRQYEQGESFVGVVVDAVGVEGLNRAFEDPEYLPTHDEVTDAEAWMRRVGLVA